jgi:adenylyltransferase/sulfurtransferase
MSALTTDETRRYNRQMLIEGWGEQGQVRLKSSTVFVAGAGGLGSCVTIYLAVAGVGNLRICDSDRVELSNLNRQILHNDSRIGVLKTESAKKTLNDLNPAVNIVTFPERLDQTTADRIIGEPDIIMDCLDNFETRYLLSRYSLRKRIPLVHGAIWGLNGQVTFLSPPETPCFRCIFPESPPKEVFPVLGVTPGLTACIQVMEALKYLTGVGTPLKGKLLLFDGQDMAFSTVNVSRAAACPDCGGAA